MKNHLIKFYLLLMFLFIGFGSCNKNSENLKSEINLKSFVEKTKAIVDQFEYTGLAKEIDFSTTTFIRNSSKGIYYTKLNSNSQFNRALISIVREDNKVLNYIIVVEKINDSTFNNYLYSLSGKQFAEYGIRNNVFSETTFLDFNSKMKKNNTEPAVPLDFIYPFDGEEFTPDSEMIAMASWWSCTKECISDAHIACYLDRDCISLLLVVNAASGVAVPKIAGIGSVSIGIACGVVCAGNTNLDMLPQY